MKTILPTPKKTESFDGDSVVKAAIFTEFAPFVKYLNTFSESFERVYDVKLENEKGGIEVLFDGSLAKNSYIFDSRDGIKLIASDVEGLMYAFATAMQAVKPSKIGIAAAKMLVEDYPEKPFRTIMIDLAREWHPASKIFKYIDVCFMLKIKYLHLHFIDDQRYTLPSKAFPEIASKQHYTFDDIKAFREYAANRGVIIIPEFEAPGHAGALNKSYPDVFANKIESSDNAQIVTEEGFTIGVDKIVCAGKREAMQGIKTLIGEIAEMFPESPYIHIGGDEANIKAWTLCSHCVEYMKENGIQDEYELYSDFIARVAQMVIDLGKTPIVWEGFPKKGADRIPRETVVIAWESHYHMVEDLLEEGFKVINATWQPLYIVNGYKLRWGPKEIMAWNVYNWQHWWPHSEARLNPKTVQPTDQVLGAQICDWNCTFEQSINFVMENSAALSERLWTVKRLWDDAEYHDRHKPVVQLIARLIQDR